MRFSTHAWHPVSLRQADGLPASSWSDPTELGFHSGRPETGKDLKGKATLPFSNVHERFFDSHQKLPAFPLDFSDGKQGSYKAD